MNDRRDCWNRDTVLSRKAAVTGAARCVAGANGSHIVFGQDGAMMIGAALPSIRGGNLSHLVNVSSVDVLPPDAPDDAANGFPAHPIAISDLLMGDATGCVQAADFGYGISGQHSTGNTLTTRAAFGLRAGAVQRTSRRVQTALGFAVEGVVARSAKEQMRGIAARRAIARMADQQGIGINPMPEPERYAMCLEIAPTDFDLTVSVTKRAGGPLPTRIGAAAIDLGPKAFGFCLGEGRQWPCSGVHGGDYTTMVPHDATNSRGDTARKQVA